MSIVSGPQFPRLHGFYEDNYRATINDAELGPALEVMDNFYMTWSGEFIHAIEHDLRRKYDLDQNIYLAFLSTQTMVWDWMAFSMKCGHYNLVARELRSILESIALFVHIENTKFGGSLQEKLKYWDALERSHRAHGKKVFRSSGMSSWTNHYGIYRKLCSFTHFGLNAYRADIELMAVTGQSLDFAFDKEKFKMMYSLWIDVANVACEAALLMYTALGETPECFGPDLYRVTT